MQDFLLFAISFLLILSYGCQQESIHEPPKEHERITEFDVDIEDTSTYSIYNQWILLGYIDRLEDKVIFKPDTIREMDITFLRIDTTDYFGAMSSCNYLSGTFTFGPLDSFNILGATTTLILCGDEGVSAWEAWYYEALTTINAFAIRGNSLALTGPENEIVFRIHK